MYVHVTFPNERFHCTLAKDFCFYLTHSNATAIFVPMAVHLFAGGFFLLNWNEFSPKICLSVCSSSPVRLGGLFFIEYFVFSTYY